MTTSAHTDISVPHSGGSLRLVIDIPDMSALTPAEAEFIDDMTEHVYGRLRRMINERASASGDELAEGVRSSGEPE